MIDNRLDPDETCDHPCELRDISYYFRAKRYLLRGRSKRYPFKAENQYS
jgi:hypothetical protein